MLCLCWHPLVLQSKKRSSTSTKPAVSFEVFSKKTKDESVILLIALMDHTKVKFGLLDDFKRALRGARRT